MDRKEVEQRDIRIINRQTREAREIREQVQRMWWCCFLRVKDDLRTNTANRYVDFEDMARKLDGMLDYALVHLRGIIQWRKAREAEYDVKLDCDEVLNAIQDVEDERKDLGNLRLDVRNRAKHIDGEDKPPPTEAELEQDRAAYELAIRTGGASELPDRQDICPHCRGLTTYDGDGACILCGRPR